MQRFILNHLSFNDLLWSLQVCLFVAGVFYYYFYCRFWLAILMKDFNCKVINPWKSRGCRSHNHSSNIKVWLEQTDLKKLPLPLHQDKIYSSNLCDIFMVILSYTCTLPLKFTNLGNGTYFRHSAGLTPP